MNGRTYPCRSCGGAGETQHNDSSDPQKQVSLHCPDCDHGRQVCEACQRAVATTRAWTRDPKFEPADVAHAVYLCDGCVGDELRDGWIVGIDQHPDGVREAGGTCCVRVGLCDVLGQSGAVTLHVPGEDVCQSWEPTLALELAAALVRAATFAAKAREEVAHVG